MSLHPRDKTLLEAVRGNTILPSCTCVYLSSRFAGRLGPPPKREDSDGEDNPDIDGHSGKVSFQNVATTNCYNVMILSTCSLHFNRQ